MEVYYNNKVVQFNATDRSILNKYLLPALEVAGGVAGAGGSVAGVTYACAQTAGFGCYAAAVAGSAGLTSSIDHVVTGSSNIGKPLSQQDPTAFVKFLKSQGLSETTASNLQLAIDVFGTGGGSLASGTRVIKPSSPYMTVPTQTQSRGVLGSNAGSSTAYKVSYGGNGQAIAGHGEYQFSSILIKEIVVPDGTTVIAPKHGTKISDNTGLFLESVNPDILLKSSANQRIKIVKNWAKKNGVKGDMMVRLKKEVSELPIYHSGTIMPNYTISSPKGLTIRQNSTTVRDSTNLDSLLQPNKGCIPLATCTVIIY